MSTIITIKVVSTKKHLKVSDVLGVNVRKDIKRVSKLLGKANGAGTNVTNTFSTAIKGYNVLPDAEASVLESRIDVVASIIRYLDSKDNDELRARVKTYHATVASEKKKLMDEYGKTAIPADRYQAYLKACSEVEVTLWATQLVVTKVSDTEFEGAVYNETSNKYHLTVKTKTVYTMNPITSETLVKDGAIEPEYQEDGTISCYTLPEKGKASISYSQKVTSGRVEIIPVVNSSGDRVLVLRRRI